MNQKILLFGETGDGKSSFINAFFGKKVANTSNSSKKCTKLVIPILNKRGSEEYTLIDTPGLNDIEKEEEKNKKQIMDAIEKEIKGNSEVTIKCILIFFKFPQSRLTGSYINALKFLMDLFPFQDFWEHVIIIRSFTNHINQYNEKTKESIDKLFAKKKQSLLDGIKEDTDLLKKMSDLNINIPNKINMKFVDSYDDLNDKINDNDYMKETMNEIAKIITKDLKPLFEYFKMSDKSLYFGDQRISYKLIEYKDYKGVIHEIKKFVGEYEFSIRAIKATSSPYRKTCRKGTFQDYQDYIVFRNEKTGKTKVEKDGDIYPEIAGREKNTQYL